MRLRGTAPEILRDFPGLPGSGTLFFAFGCEKYANPPRMSPDLILLERLRPLEFSGELE